MGGLYYHRSDRKLIVILLVIITILLIALIYLGKGNEMTGMPPAGDSLTADSASKQKTEMQQQYYAVETKQPELFYFDPNTADSTELLRLGLQPWQVRNIYKYRAKGGIYREAQDFARLYGLTVKQYKALEPYIRISPDYLPASTLIEMKAPLKKDTIDYPVKISPDEHIILNRADTNQLKRVPGIGSWYAKAIMRHGERLGGYVSVEQLSEIDNFPEEAIKYFIVENPSINKINLNKLTLNELQRHPYINFYQAKAIIDYRRLYGDLQSIDDLKLNKHFPPDKMERLRPYTEF